MELIGQVGKYEALLIVGIILIGFVLPLFFSYKLAKDKGFHLKLWVLLTLIFGWPITIALFFFPQKNDKD
jgi:hypothetical protein